MNERGVIQSVLTAEVREALTELSRYELPDNPRGEPPAGANGKSRGPRRAVH